MVKEQEKRILLFIGSCVGLYVLWFMLYEWWILPDGRLNHFMTHIQTIMAVFVFKALGYGASYQDFGQIHFVLISGAKRIGISNACNGLVLYPLFAAFIILMLGKWKEKLIFLAVGSSFIFACNVLRIVALVLINRHYHDYLDFHHRYTFTFVMYAFIFGMWVYWIRRHQKASKSAA